MEILESDLERLKRDFDKIEGALERAMPAIVEDIRELWQTWGIRADAVETGAMIRDISSRRISAREFVTGAENVPQEYFIERGVSGKNYPAKNIARRALDEMFDRDDVEQRISAEFDRIFGR